MKKDSITNRIFTAFCFLIVLIQFFYGTPISYIIESLGRNFPVGISQLAYGLGYALVIISLLTSSRQLIAVGIIMLALSLTLCFFLPVNSSPLRVSWILLQIGAYLMLAFGFFQNKHTKQFVFLASVIFLLSSILFVLSWGRFSYAGANHDIYDYFKEKHMLPCISFYLAAISLDNRSKDKSGSKALSNSSNNRIERLIKLKELLDMGAITQEEFNGKKKQILGEQT